MFFDDIEIDLPEIPPQPTNRKVYSENETIKQSREEENYNQNSKMYKRYSPSLPHNETLDSLVLPQGVTKESPVDANFMNKIDVKTRYDVRK